MLPSTFFRTGSSIIHIFNNCLLDKLRIKWSVVKLWASLDSPHAVLVCLFLLQFQENIIHYFSLFITMSFRNFFDNRIFSKYFSHQTNRLHACIFVFHIMINSILFTFCCWWWFWYAVKTHIMISVETLFGFSFRRTINSSTAYMVYTYHSGCTNNKILFYNIKLSDFLKHILV